MKGRIVTTLLDIEKAKIEAQKSGDRTRLDALRLLINEVKGVAKSDGNREATADDVITAANRMVKKGKETLSYYLDGDERRNVVLTEIGVFSEFLPQQMDQTALERLIEEFMSGAPEGKAARGYVMKELNGRYRGQFDPRAANDILAARI